MLRKKDENMFTALFVITDIYLPETKCSLEEAYLNDTCIPESNLTIPTNLEAFVKDNPQGKRVKELHIMTIISFHLIGVFQLTRNAYHREIRYRTHIFKCVLF